MKLFKVLLIITALFLFIIACGDEGAKSVNYAPVIESITADPDTVNILETTRLSCLATDQNNDILVYSWSAPDGEFPISSSGTIVLWQAPPDTGTYSVTASVSDGQLTDTETIDINIVFPSNHAPVIQSLTANLQLLFPNDIAELTCVADDEDGDSLTYTWSSSDGSFPDGTSGPVVQWQAPVEFGEYYVRVIVDDGLEAAQDSILITVDERPPAPSDPDPPDDPADPARAMRAIRGGAFYTETS
ncbi:MAG: PKD domain-containing protein [Candidatus Zixiibacteriota bacterium]|nr:MAG: PKD domain-containing protein [candidate division Zixibacteria bacterium]